MKKTSQKPTMLIDFASFSPVSESFHTLRANLDFIVAEKDMRVFTVTSAERGEGKSTAALNLAHAYARSGRKVLLIDSDFRSPSLHIALGIGLRDGLFNYLAGQVGLTEVIRETPHPCLQVMTSGALQSNPIELLTTEVMQAFFLELKTRYDRVIVDVPPLLAAIEAQIVSGASDGAILVVECRKTSRSQVEKAIKTLEHARTPLLGAVMNKANRKPEYAY